MNGMTEHITNLISEIALLNTEVNINNIVEVHLYKLDELRLKNPAYGRQSISRPMQMVAPIPQ